MKAETGDCVQSPDGKCHIHGGFGYSEFLESCSEGPTAESKRQAYRARQEAAKSRRNGKKRRRPKVIIKSASSVPMKKARWLWQGRIPESALTILGGFGGLGKSTLTSRISADVSNGALPGDSLGMSKEVLILTAEDVWESTIIPRLSAAGADLANIKFAALAIEEPGTDVVTAGLRIPEDLDILEDALRKGNFGLIVLDPLVSFLGDGTDSHNDASVRGVLDPIQTLCVKHGIAVLGVMHFNKRETRDPMAKLSSSNAFWNAARSVMFFGKKYDDPDDTDERYLVQAKSNLARIDNSTSIHYVIASTEVKGDDGHRIETSELVFMEHVEMTIETLFSTSHKPGRPPEERLEVAAVAMELLNEHGVIERKVLEEHIGMRTAASPSTIKRWLADSGAHVFKSSFKDKTWWVSHPRLDKETAIKIISTEDPLAWNCDLMVGHDPSAHMSDHSDRMGAINWDEILFGIDESE